MMEKENRIDRRRKEDTKKKGKEKNLRQKEATSREGRKNRVNRQEQEILLFFFILSLADAGPKVIQFIHQQRVKVLKESSKAKTDPWSSKINKRDLKKLS
jgi:hypothetical protein